LCILISVFVLVTSSSLGEPYDPNLATTIDAFLEAEGSPLAGHGPVFVANGIASDVDPRLIVAIAGAESSFGVNICTNYNAWNCFPPPDGYCNWPFSSWDDGIATVSKFIGIWISKGYTTIPLIEARYCGSGCQNWIPNVTSFYNNYLGGNLSDLQYVPPTGPYLSFTQGDPGTPGDGNLLTVQPFEPLTFSVPISTSSINDGFNITVFSPDESFANFQSGGNEVALTISAYASLSCQTQFGIGAPVPTGTLSVNGSSGIYTNIPQSEVDYIITSAQIYSAPGCTYSLDNIKITGMYLYTGPYATASTVRLDAVSFGLGQYNVP
jgi:hypothetical protein